MQKINSLHSFQTATSEMSNVIPLFTKLSYQRQKGGGGCGKVVGFQAFSPPSSGKSERCKAE